MCSKFCWDILDNYYQKGGTQESVNPLIKHQIDSYNKFIDNTLEQIITGFNPIKITNTLKNDNNDNMHKIYINVLQPSLTKPSYQQQDGTLTTMTPHIARMNNLTYSSNLYVNVHVIIETTNSDGIIEKFDKTVNGVYIGKIPVMVRSKACVLYQLPALGEENNNECMYDYGGYFIINGNEKVLISQDRINENKTLVFHPNNNTDGLYAEIRSMSDASYLPPKTTSLNMSGKLNHMGRIIRMNTSFIRTEIPVFIMFRALGVISDKEIIQHIVYNLDNIDNKKIISELMACCEDSCEINTQEDAENYIVKFITGSYKAHNPIELLRQNIINDFLPHVGKSYRRKALYLGFMIRKMIRIYLGYDTYDNRDSYMNKRIDTPGILMSNLLRQCYGKMTKETKNLIERELNLWRSNQSIVPTSDIITDNSIHRYFKQSLLDSWLKYSLSTGNWGIKSIGSFQNIKQGVSQVLNRMSYASTLSHLRRINTSMEKNGKLVQPRKLDNSQMGMICPAECFDPNTPILLWNGTITKAKNILVGDYLINDKGYSIKVKSICSGTKKMYEVIQHKKDFMNYTVTDNHILTLKMKKDKFIIIKNHKDTKELIWFDKQEFIYKYKTFNDIEDLDKFKSSIDNDNVIDITIEKYLSLSENIKTQLYTFKSDGINWEYKEVSLEPYTLGVWLGNKLSDTSTSEFTRIRNDTEECNITNLINNKHIPLDYLTNDRNTRLKLLAGLIDIIGNIIKNSYTIKIYYIEENNKIINDIEILIRSLGYSCNNKIDNKYYEIIITGKYLNEIPTNKNKFNDELYNKKDELESSFELIEKDIETFVGWQVEGTGRFLLGDMSVTHNTPEGASVGLVKNMALSTHISISMNSSHIREILVELNVKIYDDNYSYSTIKKEDIELIKNKKIGITEYLKELGNNDNIYIQINGDIIGYHNEPNILYEKLIHYKRCGIIYPMTSIIWNIKHRYIAISTEAGRMYRPLMIVDIDKNTGKRELRINKILEKKKISWEEFIKDKPFEAFVAPCAGTNYEIDEEGFIEYLDCEEVNNAMIAINDNELYKGMKGTSYPPCYTHCEIHPSLMNGILGVNIPFSDHNQSPRNCYQCLADIEKVYMSNGTYKYIKDIKIGDEIVSFNPNSKVLEHTKVINHYNRITTKIVYNITTASGRVITATYDHKFITNTGWQTCVNFNKDTLLGIHLNSKYKRVHNIYENCIDYEDNIIIINYNDMIDKDNNYFKELKLLPLDISNAKLPIIARICGYSKSSLEKEEFKFKTKIDEDNFNKDCNYLGFKYGSNDINLIKYIGILLKDIKWLNKCSKLVRLEFITGYLSGFYSETIQTIKEEKLNEIVKDILNENDINDDWFKEDNTISYFYKKIGLSYNNKLLSEIAILSEYVMHTEYYNKENIKNIVYIYKYETWKEIVYVEGDLIFVPYNKKYINKYNKISDLTVESDNHSFIAGNGFAVSNCAMGKQALGVYMSNFNKRIDTMGNILNYSQKPLVSTKLSKYTYSNELPSGINAVVAIMTHTGFNQEDSVMINESALDRGLYTSTYYKAFRDQCSKNHSSGEEEVFMNPINTTTLKPFSYEKLDDNGFIPKNTYVDGNDILIGKVMPKKMNGTVSYSDNSTCMKANDDGYIDANYTGINSEGYKFCKVRVRKNRKPEIGDKLACYSPDHEYLTTDGWISVSELTLNHKIASMIDGKLVYQQPIKLHEYEHKGLMYSVENNQVNMLVTPNHRMLYRPKYTGAKYQTKKAGELYHTRYKMKKDVDEWYPDYNNENLPDNFILNKERTEITHFRFEGYTDDTNHYHDELIIDIDSWITIYGIYIAEGSVQKYGIRISAHKPRVQEALNKVIERTNIKIGKYLEGKKEDDRVSWHISHTHISRHIGTGHISTNKTLKNWVWWLNRKQSQNLIFAMCLGDGCFSGNSTRYYTSSTKLADDFQRLCLHAGYSSNKSLKTKEGTRNYSIENMRKIEKEAKGIYDAEIPESYTTSDYWMLSVIKAQNEPIINKNIVSEKHKEFKEDQYQDKWVDYDGKVYCCTMPNDEPIYIRRNGKVIWGKNSRAAQKGTIGMIYKQQDMPFTKDGITPDIIMNPHAIPSRMTMAQLMECIMGKASCHIGALGDATPFTDCSVESIAKVLELSGMERYGNEIMYNGRTGEQIKTEIFIGPTYYQRLKHMVCDKLHCLTSEHDVLTKEGWKKINEITINDKVAVLKGTKLVYENPLEIHKYPEYNGKMYKIKNDTIDLDVTLNHRMYISEYNTEKKEWDRYKLSKAENIIGKNIKYKTNASWIKDEYQFILPEYNNNKEKILDMKSWLIFYGIYITEKEEYLTNKKYVLTIDYNNKKYKKLNEVLKNMGFKFYIKQDEFNNKKIEIVDEQLYSYLDKMRNNNKKLPEWVWELNKEQSKILYKSMLYNNYVISDNTKNVFNTRSSILADEYMILLLHSGISGIKSIISFKTDEDNKDIYQIKINKNVNEPLIRNNTTIEEIYNYKGPVYCLSVSSEIFMVRKDGKQCWTGNSRGSNGPIVMLTRQPSEGRARNGGLRLGEMERDCFIGHGVSSFLKEKMLDTSDNYRIFICKNCGLNANVNPEKSIYKCSNCQTAADIVQSRLPYAFKLLSQELYSMNVLMRYVCN